MLLISEVAV